MTASAYDMTTVAAVKQLLGIPTATTDYDAMIQDLITAASSAIEAITGYDFVQRTRVEDHPYDEFACGVMRLFRKPIVSITSIVDPAGNTLPASNYSVLKNRAELRGFFSLPVDANGNVSYWTVTYATGKFSNTAALMNITTGDPNAEMAAKQTVVDWYRRRGGEQVASKSVGDLSISYAVDNRPSALQLPESVMGLLAPYMNYIV